MVRVNHLIFFGFFAMTWIVAIFSERTFADVLLTLFFSICCAISLAYPLFRREKQYTTKDKTMTVRRFRIPATRQIFPILESKIAFLISVRKWNENLLGTVVPLMGISVDTEKIATIATRICFTAFIPCIILGIYLGMTQSEIFLAICAAPAVIFFAPYINLRLGILERKTRIEEEMAYFLVYVNIMQTVGMSLYHAFDMLRGEKVFPAMERDASEIVKRVDMIGVTQNDSLSIYAQNHPSSQFRDFINGYIAKITSVGNVPAYTESKAKYFFDEYLGKWSRYEQSAKEFFSAILMISMILPMMIMLISMLGGPQSSQGLLLIGNFVSPLMSVLMIVMLNSSQPATGTKIKLSYLALVSGAAVTITAFVAGISLPTALASGVLIGASANYILIRKDIAKIRAVDTMMPEFMRDVTEMSKTGQNINQIITKQAEKHAYRKEFNQLLEDIAARVQTGQSFDSVSRQIRTDSTHVKFIMFILSKTYVTGGGSTDIFNYITEFITKITQAKSKVTKSLKSMSMIVYASPFLMLGISHMMVSMFTGDATPAPSGNIPFASLSVDESILDSIRLMTVFTVIPIGAVAAKITSYTVKDTMPIVISCLSLILAMHIVPIVFEMVTF